MEGLNYFGAGLGLGLIVIGAGIGIGDSLRPWQKALPASQTPPTGSPVP